MRCGCAGATLARPATPGPPPHGLQPSCLPAWAQPQRHGAKLPGWSCKASKLLVAVWGCCMGVLSPCGMGAKRSGGGLFAPHKGWALRLGERPCRPSQPPQACPPAPAGGRRPWFARCLGVRVPGRSGWWPASPLGIRTCKVCPQSASIHQSGREEAAANHPAERDAEWCSHARPLQVSMHISAAALAGWPSSRWLPCLLPATSHRPRAAAYTPASYFHRGGNRRSPQAESRRVAG